MQNNTEPLIVGQLPRKEEKMPLFIMKLWNIVEDRTYRDVIRWDESGSSFQILDPSKFCRNVLPQHFRHNNLNSLIRQLNLYGFHRMTSIERSGLVRAESGQDRLKFSHPYFVREQPELLVNIKRKAATHRPVDTTAVSVASEDPSLVLDEIRQLKENQRAMENKMTHLVKENELVWQQLSHMRSMHVKQQQVVNELFQFLVTFAQPSEQTRFGKRSLLAIDEVGSKRARLSNGQSAASTAQPTNLSEVLNRLQRALVDGDGNGAFPNLFSPPAGQGPIIADITYEPDPTVSAVSDLNQHLMNTQAGAFTSRSSFQHDKEQNQDNEQLQQLQQLQSGQAQAQDSLQQGQPPAQQEQQNFASFCPTLTLMPSLDRQISDCLNCQEQEIDVGGYWDLDFHENLDDEP